MLKRLTDILHCLEKKSFGAVKRLARAKVEFCFVISGSVLGCQLTTIVVINIW